jgi:hypothetical protein
MLKAVVNLNRKITRDYNSTGYGVSVEGEISATPDDHEGVLGRIKELFGLAEEALALEIDRDQSEDAIGCRDEERPAPAPTRSNGNGTPAPTNPPHHNDQPNGNGQPTEERITDKQIKYLFSLAKRTGLGNGQLENQIEQVVGRRARVYDLSKREAGRVIDSLTKDGNASARPVGQR